VIMCVVHLNLFPSPIRLQINETDFFFFRLADSVPKSRLIQL
jgi:hypothetical protein